MASKECAPVDSSQPPPYAAQAAPPYNPNPAGFPAPTYNQATMAAVGYNPGNPSQVNVVHQVMQLRPEQFLTDYRTFAVVIAFLFGIVGPVSLLTGIPAAYMAIAGYRYMKKGMYEKSRTRSIISVYLTFGTMFLSIISSTLIICLLVGYRYSYT